LFAATQAYEESLRQRWAANGLSQDRLLFAPPISSEAHLSRTAHLDLLLSPFPCASPPMQSMLCARVFRAGIEGQSVASRNLASILLTHGIPETDQFQHSQNSNKRRFSTPINPIELQNVENRLRGLIATSPLFDQRKHVLALEKGLPCSLEALFPGQAPARIDVSPD